MLNITVYRVMKFTQAHVPDKRWHNNLRPVVVNGNAILWSLWKITTFIKNILDIIIIIIEKSFKEIDDSTEGIEDGKEK